MRPNLYASGVNRAMRFYVRNPAPNVSCVGSDDLDTWRVCDTVMTALTQRERDVVTCIYQSKGKIPDVVCDTATRYTMDTEAVWRLLNRVTLQIAQRHGLVQGVANC